jgi:hypothetical protein
VLLEHVPLFEAAFVEQQFEPLARGQLAPLVLRIDAPLAAAQSVPARAFRRACE